MSAAALLKTTYEHIQLDAKGIPVIADTTMKVVELITSQIAYGWSPEELHFQYPFLSMAQIHSALAYYWDHKDELDADIERRSQYAQEMRRQTYPSPLVVRLRTEGFLK